MRGVAIFLSPEFASAYKNAGAPEPTTTPNSGEFSGRFIGVPLLFNNYDDYGKKLKGNLKIFLTSIYHPVLFKEQKDFNKILCPLLK